MDEYQYRWAQKYIELADVTVGRREDLNKMFLVANSGLLTVESYFTIGTHNTYSALCLAGLGIGLCLIWTYISNYYRNLMNAKGRVIRKLEEQLKLYPWTQQRSEKGPSPWYSLSLLEIAMPLPFIMLNLLIVLNHQVINEGDKLVFYIVITLFIVYAVSFFVLFVRNFLEKLKAVKNKKGLGYTQDEQHNGYTEQT